MIGRFAFLSIFFATALAAQAPHDDWRTIATAHFRVHYPARYEAWATRAAARLESVRAAVVTEVGFAPETVTDVLIENPTADANGITIALLDTPRIVLYAEPPEPETQIGEYSNWIDLLTVHETAHVVHLLRPSRNPFDRALAHLLPLNTITLHAPRWVLEGYATLIEGRITGSGRPSGAMRAAVLRTWAMNGQLPTYSQLNSDRRFLGMSMAYLAGSAFLEWLVEKNGADSLRNLWARMTARQRRSFDSAFAGVFGDTPQRLYGRFTAELSENAMTVARASGWKDGELWQETTRGSGDPAISPDGTKLAIVLRNSKGEATLAIFSTGANEEEAKNAQRVAEMLRRDPQDVAPVRTKPFPRKPLHSFKPPDGGDIDNPRWTRDGSAIIYTHKQLDLDGFLHHDLFRWNPASARTERLTHLADVKDADPIDATHAVAVRSRFGESQVVIVDLTTGAITPSTEPSLDVVYSHPRVAADGRVAWAEHVSTGVGSRESGVGWITAASSPTPDPRPPTPEAGEWHVVIDGKPCGTDTLVCASGKLAPLPVAGAFSPEWTANGALFAAVAGRGFIDIARVDETGASYVTRSAGMALSPAPSPDGSLYFMSLDPDGFVVRRLADPTPLPSSTLTFDRSLVPALPPPPATPIALQSELVTPHAYGLGRQEWSTTFGGQYTSFGHTTEFALRLGDVIGRLDTLILGAISTRDLPRGFAIASVWRGLPIAIAAHAFDTRETRGLELRATRDAVFPLSHLSISAGALAAPHRNRAFLDAHFTTHQRRIASERIDLAADSANHRHATARASIRTGALTFGATLSAGRHLTLGGTPSSIEPDSTLLDRILDPAFARGSLSSSTYRGERLSIGVGGITAFWQRHHLGRDIDLIGVETNLSIPPMPLVKTPGLQLTAGVAQVRLTRKIRGWVGVRWRS